MSGSWISEELRRLVTSRASGLCEYCLLHETDSAYGFHVDHVIAEKHDGPTDDHNLCLCCPPCNRAKGSDISTLVNGKMVRLFNPRIDIWAEHFALDGIVIRAKSLSAAGTLKLLRINDGPRLQLRQLLVDSGRFPSQAALARLAKL
ncbi:HNH endonuclease [Prosthecobacter fusiformis]|uniref:HNH endonuclease n=1 Tax=Prosthecobacter fusiformis TaxID=48464 RepID=UPI00105D6DC4